MKSRHFKCVPRFLDDDLSAKRLDGVRQLPGVPQAQKNAIFEIELQEMRHGPTWT
jgi:hypothetical protein